MSAIAFLIACAIAILAALIRAAILGSWTARGIAGDFAFALLLLLLPAVIHA